MDSPKMSNLPESADKGSVIDALIDRIAALEDAVTAIGYDSKASKKRRFISKKQDSLLKTITRAICVETIDPWKQNKVRYYHPMLHAPETPLTSLPFASPVSSMGGIDDCGLNWVPPAGSTLLIFFEGGSRDSAFYLGTTWHRNVGPNGTKLLEVYPSKEYESIHQGHRKGYLVGSNDGSQVLPPWNTESYNGPDIDHIEDLQGESQEHQNTTSPNIYGFKTPEKHMVKMADGDPRCNRRWKRFEMMSGCGNWMMMKDDHLHYGGQWSSNKCSPNPGGESVDHCSESEVLTDLFGNPIESSKCDGKSQSSSILGGHSSTPGDPLEDPTEYYKSQMGSNKFFKHANECRPYKGPGTPQNNRCALPQTGIQFLSISGHTMVMDDSVEEPRGDPTWERSTQDFDYGCSDRYMGLVWLKSSTGHGITMSDIENPGKVRGEKNYVQLKSAAGNRVELNDHTVGSGGENAGCPPYIAGPERGIHLESTSGHTIKMIDEGNRQCSPTRKGGAKPESKATNAYTQIKSGSGMELRFSDDFSQETTQQQWVQLLHPQCIGANTDDECNSCAEPECRGPHFLRFQGRPKGQAGVVFLRAGGHSIRQTYDMDIVLVGDKERNPSDKFTYVSKKHISSSEDVHFRYSGESHIFFAEKKIILQAGRDCPPPPENPEGCKGPCLFPVVIARCPVTCPVTGIIHWTEKSASERVFASAYHPCQAGCGGGCDSYESKMAQASEPPCNECTEKTIDTGRDNPVTLCTQDQPNSTEL